MRRLTYLFTLIMFFIISSPAFAAPQHAIAMNGSPKYTADFKHFDYVNPEAPKNGDIKLSAIGTYDSFNPFIIKGVSAEGIGLTFDTLTVQSDDEPFTAYGLIAEKIEMPEDRSWVKFYLNKNAIFHDGSPITAEDVKFSYDILIEKGSPIYKRYYGDIKSVIIIASDIIQFNFKSANNRELPLIVGQISIISKADWKNKDFSKTTLTPPLGSGPYKVSTFQAGKSVTYERVKNYWAENLPVMKGRFNFNQIRYDYYRDQTVALEAFKSGEYDFIQENRSKQWSTLYKGPQFKSGKIIKETIKHQLPLGMQGFAMNTRKPLFKDPRVRQALTYAFDFEWSNKNLFYNQYARTHSYFSNSELASSGLPSKEEFEILTPLRDQIPPEVFTQEYRSPSTKGDGNNRQHLRTAVRLLKSAGWMYKNKKLIHSQTGKPFSFEVLLYSPSFERVILPYKQNLAKLGIDINIRMVDTSQYVNRIRSFDYDMLVVVIGQSNSPGNEQRYFFHSESADTPGSRNYMGIKNPAIDTLVDLVVNAPDREQLIHRTRALDRVLLWNHYIVPNWHYGFFRVAYQNKISKPTVQPKYDLGFHNWWIKP